MKRIAKYAFLLLLFGGHLHSEPTPVGPISFGKGLNLGTAVTDIAEDETPDSCNCINNRLGAAVKRNGSSRYINQARSSQPVTSIYREYVTTGTVVKKILMASMGDKIVYSTTDVNPAWITISSNLYPSQNWNWITMNGKAIGAPTGLRDEIKQFDILTESFSNLCSLDNTTTSVVVRGKYPIMSKNYFIVANVAISTYFNPLPQDTTYYASRLYYSILNKPSSMTAIRFEDFKTDDGESITGIGSQNDRVNVFKPSSIAELDYSVLNLLSLGGDKTFDEVVSGFGLYAPKTLANTGQYYIMGSKDGIRIWTNRVRLTSAEESQPISVKIKPLIDRLIRAGTYERAVGKWYKKKQWYILSYEDPDKSPHGANNSVIVYDFLTGEWFPFCNWLAESFETADGATDNGQLYYGDSMDSYVHLADQDIKIDDSRKEIVLDTMDSSITWIGSSRDLTNVVEGTGALKMFTGNGVTHSSMSIVSAFSVGEWYDKSKITKADKLSFKIFTASAPLISSLRIDLEVNNISDNFDTNFTSVTLSSSAFLSPTSSFLTVEIALTSFPVRPDWTSFNSELVPFANTLAYYGIRFVMDAVGASTVTIDDVRIVEATDNLSKMYRFTKLFNFGSMAFKNVGQVLLTMEKSPDSNLLMDVYNDFGSKVRSDEFAADIPKEIIILGATNKASVTVLDSVDFSVKATTVIAGSRFFNGTANANYIFLADRDNSQIVKLDRQTFGNVVSTYGSMGNGTTNFNLIHQMDLDDQDIYLIDLTNQRIKVHSQSDLSFKSMTGSLGNNTTSFHQPTGIAVDDSNLTVADEGNYRLLDLSKSTLAYVSNTLIDYNTIGDTSIEMDETSKYLAYDKINETNLNFQDVILEKRDKGNDSLTIRVKVYPQGLVVNSTYTMMGDIALLGRYLFIPFCSDENFGPNSTYYLQKRLKSDFSIVAEYKSPTPFYSVIGDALAYKPMIKNEKKDLKGGSSKYIQIKYYDDQKDNYIKLFNQTFLMTPQTIQY